MCSLGRLIELLEYAASPELDYKDIPAATRVYRCKDISGFDPEAKYLTKAVLYRYLCAAYLEVFGRPLGNLLKDDDLREILKGDERETFIGAAMSNGMLVEISAGACVLDGS